VTRWLIDHHPRAFLADFFDSGTDETDVGLISQLAAIILMAKHHPSEGFKLPQR
jgi:hypothetical protein